MWTRRMTSEFPIACPATEAFRANPVRSYFCPPPEAASTESMPAIPEVLADRLPHLKFQLYTMHTIETTVI